MKQDFYPFGDSENLRYNQIMKTKTSKPAKKTASKQPPPNRFVAKESDVVITPPKKKKS